MAVASPDAIAPTEPGQIPLCHHEVNESTRNHHYLADGALQVLGNDFACGAFDSVAIGIGGNLRFSA